MINLDLDARLIAWSDLRKQIETSDTPLEDAIVFWNQVKCSAQRSPIDPYYSASWPTPWEIIEHNLYDDFTKAVMIGYTLLLTEKYKKTLVEIKTLVDKTHNKLYNVVCIDDCYVLNFDDNEIITCDQVPETCYTENIVSLIRPR